MSEIGLAQLVVLFLVGLSIVVNHLHRRNAIQNDTGQPKDSIPKILSESITTGLLSVGLVAIMTEVEHPNEKFPFNYLDFFLWIAGIVAVMRLTDLFDRNRADRRKTSPAA